MEAGSDGEMKEAGEGVSKNAGGRGTAQVVGLWLEHKEDPGHVSEMLGKSDAPSPGQATA